MASQRPDSCHSSACWTTGMDTSMAPERSISSRTIWETLWRTRRPSGSQVYKPLASFRIMPARSMS